MLAPLVIFVYNRIEVTKKMLQAINSNELASDTEVYIFSDGAKHEADIEKVNEVRRYIEYFVNNNDFKSVKVKCAESNKGLANSVISGVSEIIGKYQKVIVLEDDLITAPVFLKFMNECLDYYERNDKVWSIGGTCLNLPSLQNYPKDVYSCYRATSTGWGTWQNRWELVDWEVLDYTEFRKSRQRIKKFRRGGQDMPSELKRQLDGETDSWAIRWCYQQSKEDMITILPKTTLIENIGWNTGGVHSDVDRFHLKIVVPNFNYKLCNVEVEQNIMSEFRQFFYRSWIQRVMDKIYLNVRKLCKCFNKTK